MPLILELLLAAAFAALVGGAVHVWRRQFEAARREDIRALAARRGWAVTETEERLGRAGALRIVPRGGHPWTAEVRPAGSAQGDAAAGPVTEYASEGPRWAEGTLVLVAAPPPGGEAPPSPAEADAARALRRLLGEGARPAAGLRRVAAPEGTTAFADGDPARRVLLADLARILAEWRPAASGERGLPVLVLSPDGLRLRLRHALRRADHIERFVDLALALSRVIGP